MRKSKFTEEQIIGFLKQAEAGMVVAEICRKGSHREVAAGTGAGGQGGGICSTEPVATPGEVDGCCSQRWR